MPRFSPEQVRRRQLVAGALALTLILVLGGCTALLIGAFRSGEKGAGSERVPFEADDDAMIVGSTAADASALGQLPKGTELADDEVMGIDVSSYQGEIDWEQVASDGYAFAYIKATEGADFADASFRQNWDGAQAAGITPGAYHYFTLCSSGAAQAADFLAAAPPDDSALPPALDLEFDGVCEARPEAADAQAEIDAFTAAVEEEWGRRLIIYSSAPWRDHYGLPVTDARPDWLFSGAGRPGQADWALWQLRFDGEVSGVKGGVDIDVARIEVLREHSTIGPDDGALSHDVVA